MAKSSKQVLCSRDNLEGNRCNESMKEHPKNGSPSTPLPIVERLTDHVSIRVEPEWADALFDYLNSCGCAPTWPIDSEWFTPAWSGDRRPLPQVAYKEIRVDLSCPVESHISGWGEQLKYASERIPHRRDLQEE